MGGAAQRYAPSALGEQFVRFGLPFSLVLVGAVAVTWLLDRWSASDLAAEGRALAQRAFELNLRALAPGSPLGCLEGTAGELMDDACERALFATPESTAGAVSYVAAQLSLLAAGKQHALASGSSYSKVLPTVRRAIETDRFGIVGYVFAARPACRADKCELFDLLENPSRVKANLAAGTFDSYLRAHMASWVSTGSRGLAGTAPPDTSAPVVAVPSAAAKPPSGVFFPSSASIPSVNIMTAEPPSAQQTQESAASAESANRSRKQPQAPAQARQPASADAGQSRSGPLQITPATQ